MLSQVSLLKMPAGSRKRSLTMMSETQSLNAYFLDGVSLSGELCF